MNMTGSAYSTASTIDAQPPPDRQLARGAGDTPPARPSVAAIVTSLHGRTGKTLLARVLTEYFILSGRRPLVFDTDAAEQALHASFPSDAVVVEVNEVRDQMTLFDTLAVRSGEARVVDVSHHVFRKFFKVMQDSHLVAEARERGVEPIIFYIADRNEDGYEEARRLRERFADCAFVLVENAYLGRVKDVTRRSAGYRALETHDLRMTLPRLDVELADALDDRQLSLSDLLTKPLSRGDVAQLAPDALAFDQRVALRAWLVRAFQEIHRITREVALRAPLLPADPVY